MKPLTTAALFVIAALSSVGRAQADYVFAISTDHPVIGVDDDLVVTATVVNPSRGPQPQANVVGGDGWIGDPDYEFDLRDSSGNKVPDSAYVKRLRHSVRLGGAPFHSFPPQKQISEKIDISAYFDIPGPGTYLLQVTGYGIPSNTLEVTILPVAEDSAVAAAEVALAPVPAIPSSGPLQRGLAIRIDVDRSTVFAGSEIPVVTGFFSVPGRSLEFPFAGLELELTMEVRGTNGALAAESPLTQARKAFIESHQGHGGATIRTTPAMSINADIEITKLYDMSSPGVYRIQFAWKVPESLGGGEIRSNMLTVTVKARRPLR